MDGLYDYGSTTYGSAFGKYAAGESWISIDSTDGLRINYGTTPTVLGQWDASGNVTIGEVGASKSNVYITSGALQMRTNEVVNIQLDANGNATFGNVAANQGNMYWDNTAKQVKFRGGAGGTAVEAYIDTDGSFTAGAGDVVLDSDGLALNYGSGDTKEVKWDSGGTKYAWVAGADYGSDVAVQLGALKATTGTVYTQVDASNSFDGTQAAVWCVSAPAAGYVDFQLDGASRFLIGKTKAYAAVASYDIHTTGQISTDNGTTEWDLGSYAATTDTATGHIKITINGTEYRVLTYLAP